MVKQFFDYGELMEFFKDKVESENEVVEHINELSCDVEVMVSPDLIKRICEKAKQNNESYEITFRKMEDNNERYDLELVNIFKYDGFTIIENEIKDGCGEFVSGYNYYITTENELNDFLKTANLVNAKDWREYEL